MSIDIAPETELVVREELRSVHFRSIDDLILSGVQAWREREMNSPTRGINGRLHPPTEMSGRFGKPSRRS